MPRVVEELVIPPCCARLFTRVNVFGVVAGPAAGMTADLRSPVVPAFHQDWKSENRGEAGEIVGAATSGSAPRNPDPVTPA